MKTLEKNKNRGKIKNGILTILLISHLKNALEYKTDYHTGTVMLRHNTLILWTHMKQIYTNTS